jgi:signal transduction histidine kinase
VLTRVLLSYGLLTVSFALVAGFSVLGQRQSVRETELMRSGYIPLIVALRDAVASQNTVNSQLNNVTEARNPADKRVWFETNLALGRPKVFAELRAAMAFAFAKDERGLGRQLSAEVGRIERFLEGDREILARLFDALKREDSAQAEKLRDQLVTRGSQALEELRELENRVNAHLDDVMGAISKRERWTFRVLVGWVLFTVGIGIAVSLYARKVLKPLAQITERAEAVARGDLTPREVKAADDEIGELATTFEAMVSGIARANRELLESERLATIGKMAAHVTHEVRNPLSSIALNLELLSDELPASSEARALHQAIEREVRRLSELTEQYLSLTRPHKPNLQQENVGELVGEALSFLKPDLDKAGVDLSLEVEEDLPASWVDDAQLRQVLQNLVRNARQAMPDGGKLIVSVTAEVNHVAIAVADEGVGMAPEVRERLFEPFLTTKEHGTGLGLAISRHIIEAHGGTIRCEANEPKGTRFVIELPSGRPTSADGSEPPVAAD